MCSSLFERGPEFGSFECNDTHAGGGASRSFTSSIPVPWKMGIGGLLLALNLFVDQPLFGLGLFILSAALALFWGTPLRSLLVKLTVPLTISILAGVSQLLWYGSTPLYRATFLGASVVVFREGIHQGLVIGARILGGLGVVLLISATIAVEEILSFARRHRVQPTFVDAFSLTFRYMFVLRDRARSIREAQVLRFGYADFRKTLRSVGILGGKLVIDSFDRSGPVYESMKLRRCDLQVRQSTIKDSTIR